MSSTVPQANQAAIRKDDRAICVSLELSQSKWLVTLLAPDSEKLSKYNLAAGETAKLLSLLEDHRRAVGKRLGQKIRVVTIQEAGRDGFWLHRALQAHGIESHVVDPASIAVPRRKRRAKSDRIDGEVLVRTLTAWLRKEPRVCAMVQPPSVEQEDRRRVSRERDGLIKDRTRMTNRIQSLLATHGVRDYAPLRRDSRARLEELKAATGEALPPQLVNEIGRLLDRLALLATQLKAVEKQRNAQAAESPIAVQLTRLRGIGPEFASVLWLECFYRTFPSRRQVAAYSGLAPTPWQSGQIDQEQGISGAGNRKLRQTMIELSWLWLMHQPHSDLSRWYFDRVGPTGKGRVKRISIVALARKLLVDLWRYVTDGVVPAGAVLKTV